MWITAQSWEAPISSGIHLFILLESNKTGVCVCVCHPFVGNYKQSDLRNYSQVSNRVQYKHKSLWMALKMDRIDRALLAGTVCKGPSAPVSQQTNKQTYLSILLDVTLEMCALALYVRQLKCTLYTGIFKRVIVKPGALRHAAAIDEDSYTALIQLELHLTVRFPPFLSLSCFVSFRTNWCCLCANLLSRNTP